MVMAARFTCINDVPSAESDGLRAATPTTSGSSDRCGYSTVLYRASVRPMLADPMEAPSPGSAPSSARDPPSQSAAVIPALPNTPLANQGRASGRSAPLIGGMFDSKKRRKKPVYVNRRTARLAWARHSASFPETQATKCSPRRDSRGPQRSFSAAPPPPSVPSSCAPLSAIDRARFEPEAPSRSRATAPDSRAASPTAS